METAANRPLSLKVSMNGSMRRVLGVGTITAISETTGVWHQHVWHSEDAAPSSKQSVSRVQCIKPITKATAKRRAVSWIRRECIAGKLRDVPLSCKWKF